MGEILCHRPLKSVLLICPLLGRKEDPASSGDGVQASGIRLETMEQGMAVRNARTLFGVSSVLCPVNLGSRSRLKGHITLIANCAGARSAGNPLATCDVAGAGNRFTVRLVRHSQRKRGATDRPDLRNNGASPRPYRGRIGGKRSLETMTPEERTARAKKASLRRPRSGLRTGLRGSRDGEMRVLCPKSAG